MKLKAILVCMLLVSTGISMLNIQNLNIITYGSILNNTPQTGRAPVPEDYELEVRGGEFAVVGVRPETGDDFDLEVYTDNSYSTLIESSKTSGDSVDLVALEKNTWTSPPPRGVRVTKGTKSYVIEMENEIESHTTSDTWSGYMDEYPGNPVLDVGPPGSWDNLKATYPTVIKDGSTYKMWYTGSDGIYYRIFYATSSDGIGWTKYPNPVLDVGSPGSWEDESLGASTVIKDGNEFKMWYFAHGQPWQIGYATSTDGITWTKHPNNPVLRIGSSGSWESNSIAFPWVIKEGNQYKMWYGGRKTGYSGLSYKLGYATSSDGINWNKYSGNPIMDFGSPGEWDDLGVSDYSIIEYSGSYYMWYTGWNGTDISIGEAFSKDGSTWIKNPVNPVLVKGSSGSWDDIGAFYPTVLNDAGKIKMWYSGSNTSKNKIGYATLTSKWMKHASRAEVLDAYEITGINSGLSYTMDLEVPSTADLDLFIYDNTGGRDDALASSTNIGSGTDESINFIAPTTGDYLLVVTNENGGVGEYTISQGGPPVADAGVDQTVNEGDIISLDGSKSKAGGGSRGKEGLISYWRFDEGTGDIAYDSHDSNDGNILGPVWTSGQVNDALQFDGLDDYVDGGNNNNLKVSGSLTVETWAKYSDYTGASGNGIFPNIVSNADYALSSHKQDWKGFFLSSVRNYPDPSRNGMVRFSVLNPTLGEQVQSPNSYDDGKWHHIVGVFEPNSHISLYVDGQMVANKSTTFSSFTPGTFPLSIGRGSENDMFHYFAGSIDEVAIYERALGQREILCHYNSSLFGKDYFQGSCGSSQIISYEWDFESDGIYDYQETTISAPDGSFDGITTHTYGDNGIYMATLRVTDNKNLTDTDTCNITVLNVVPTIQPLGTLIVNEGTPISLNVTTFDPGSDDLIISWDFGDVSTIITNEYYNNGLNPEPSYNSAANEIKSPKGTYPFSVSSTQSHVWGDNGIYTLIVTVSDDDGGTTSAITNITVNNVVPTISLLIAPSGDEGSSLIFQAQASDYGSDDLTYTWDFEYGPTIVDTHFNDGLGPEPVYDPVTNEIKSPFGSYPYSTFDNVTHTYGDNYNYSLVLTVSDDDGGVSSVSTSISISNLAPSITGIEIPSSIYEGSSATFEASAFDLGSDDLTFNWDFEMGSSLSTVYLNDGLNLDPLPSPWGNFSFNASDSVVQTYGDNGVFTLTLTVSDDDGGTTTFRTNVSVLNVLPRIQLTGPTSTDENSPITLNTTVYDPGSDDLMIIWEWGDGFSNEITTIYYNDGMGPDPFPSPDINPINTSESQGHTYGDNGVFTVSVTVMDDDGGISSITHNVTVINVNPSIESLEAFTFVNLSLRVAGEKWHSVGIQLFEEETEIWAATVTRQPGNPDEQIAKIDHLRVDMTENYTALVEYLPNDPRTNGNVWGGNPVWIDMEFPDGSTERLHHTFNVRQSYWDTDHWNHIDPWEVDLKNAFVGHSFEVSSHIKDPGSDDLTLLFTYGSQAITKEYLNDPPNIDPYPSPEINPRDIMDTTSIMYEGTGILTLSVEDDDRGSDLLSLDIK